VRRQFPSPKPDLAMDDDIEMTEVENVATAADQDVEMDDVCGNGVVIEKLAELSL
jgi:hypothetical protein